MSSIGRDERNVQNPHYSSEYFAWQRELGEFGGKANISKFEAFVRPADKVLEFGAGGGYLLRELVCEEKVGIEVNPAARAVAEEQGLRMLRTLEEVPDGSVDVILSNHALEHVDAPLHELLQAFRVLRAGGLIVFVVPCEAISSSFREEDINQHLYTWAPMNLGNLFARAGFRVLQCTPYIHTWPPGYRTIQRLLGWRLFHVVCRIWGQVSRRACQVRCVAVKKEPCG